MNLRWKSTSAITSAALISALSLSACAADDSDDNDDDPQPTATVTETVEAEPTEETTDETTDSPAEETEPTDDTTESAEENNGDEVYEALDAVIEEYPDAVVLDFETESSYYEFTIFEDGSEWELDVDRDNYEISNTRESNIDSDDQRNAEAVEIELTEALRTASEEGDGAPEQADLDDDNGTVTWEIELDNGQEVYVDATTGDVVTGGGDD